MRDTETGRFANLLSPGRIGGVALGDRAAVAFDPAGLPADRHSSQKSNRVAPLRALMRPADAPGKWAGRITVSVSA